MLDYFIILVLILWIAYKWQNSFGNKVKIQSEIDGIKYNVLVSSDQTQAANIFAKMNEIVVRLLENLKDTYITGKLIPPQSAGDYLGPYTKISPRISATKLLLARYNPDNLIENSPNNPIGDTSYTFQKGKILAMCIRDKSNQIQDENLLIFVNIHELSHIAIEDTQHSQLFWYTFRFLLWTLDCANIYKSPDFKNQAMDYCNGMNVRYNPLYDQIN